MDKEKVKVVFKRISAVLMAVIMLLCVAPLEGIAEFNFSAFKLSASALEVGETFTEGFYTYEVTAVYEFISHAHPYGEVKIKDVDENIGADVHLPNFVNGYKVTAIGNYAFYNSKKMFHITIPDTVTNIGECAFKECYNLYDVNLPDTIIRVGKEAFKNIALDNTSDPGKVFYVGSIVCDSSSSWTQSQSRDIILKEGTRIIADGAFARSFAEKITIPSSVEYIGYEALGFKDVYFSDLTSLLNIKFGEPDEGVAYYGPLEKCNLYINNTLVTDVVIPDEISDLSNVFRGYKNLKSIVFSNSMTEIKDYSFNNCNNLVSVSIPSSVQKIGYAAFRDSGLTSVTIPGSVKEIGSHAFESCDALKNVDIKNGVNIIKNRAFENCANIEFITIPPSIKEIWEDAFAYCYKLNKVYITDLVAWLNIDFGVGMDENYSYSSMANPLCYDGTLYIKNVETKHLVIPEGITKIKKGSFIGSDAIRTIIIPEGVTEIEAGAFGWCNYLEGVIIPKSVKKIGYDAFRYAGYYTGCDFCYRGTEEEWKNIEIYSNFFDGEECFYFKYDYTENHIHQFNESEIKATYKTEGKIIYTCNVCNYSYFEIIDRYELDEVEGLEVKKSASNSVTLSWKKVEGAEGYKIYYSTNGKKWKTVKVTKNSATIKKLSSAKNYQFKVRAYAGKYYGDASKIVKTTTKFTTVTLSKVNSTKKKTALVTWKKVTDATGYIVEYSTSKKFTKKTTKTVNIKKGKTTKTTLKKLKSGKKYYVRLKAYKTVSKKTVYGSYSSVKTVKIK